MKFVTAVLPGSAWVVLIYVLQRNFFTSVWFLPVGGPVPSSYLHSGMHKPIIFLSPWAWLSGYRAGVVQHDCAPKCARILSMWGMLCSDPDEVNSPCVKGTPCIMGRDRGREEGDCGPGLVNNGGDI